jgi:hypothetical protein
MTAEGRFGPNLSSTRIRRFSIGSRQDRARKRLDAQITVKSEMPDGLPVCCDGSEGKGRALSTGRAELNRPGSEAANNERGDPARSLFSGKAELKTYSLGTATSNSAYLGFALPGQLIEFNEVKDLKLEFSTRDERVKVSLRDSESTYQAHSAYLFGIAGPNPFGAFLGDKLSQEKSRFLFNNQPIGMARSEKIDVKVIDGELLKLTGFAFHTQTGDAYYSDQARRNPNDDFAVSNRWSRGFGQKVVIGPVCLTSKFRRTERIFGMNAPSERSLDHTLLVDLEDVWRRIRVSGSFLSSLAPSNVYAGVFNKSTIFRSLTDGVPDETKGTTAGAHWGSTYGSFDINYFRYFLDSRRLGDQNYDSAGRGASASLSSWTDRFVVSGGLSLTQTDFLPATARNQNRFLNAYATATVKLDELPDVFVDFTGYRYQYVDQYGHAGSTSWSSSFGLELSKYLGVLAREGKGAASTLNFAGASLRTLYRYQTGMDYVLPGQGGPRGHFIGLSFHTALK